MTFSGDKMVSFNLNTDCKCLNWNTVETFKLKFKTDVYSLGVIILELLTEKSPSEALNGVVCLSGLLLRLKKSRTMRFLMLSC